MGWGNPTSKPKAGLYVVTDDVYGGRTGTYIEAKTKAAAIAEYKRQYPDAKNIKATKDRDIY